MKTIKLILILLLLVSLSATAFGSNNPEKSRMYVEETFVYVLIEQFGVKLEDLSVDTNLRDDLGADNTDLAELLMALEEYFDIAVSDVDWEGVTTIGSAVDLIFDLRNERGW